MNRLFALVLALPALLLVAQRGEAGTISAVDLGTGAPPTTLGGYSMTPFPNDARPVFNNVTTVPSPLGGDLGFSIPLSHREVPTSWSTWSHGYTGDVYYTNGATAVTLTMPAGTGAFYFYAEPNPFGVFNITATADDGTSLTLPVNGASGARGYGFFASPGSSIAAISVNSTADFAVGEFGIAATQNIPEPATVAVFGGLVAGAFGLRRRVKAKAA